MSIVLEDWILFVFFCVSIVLYVLVMVTLIVNRKNELLNGPFFVMTLFLGISEIVATLDNWLLVKPRMMGLFYDFYSILDPLAARLGNYISWWMPAWQLTLTSLITVNRFISIVWPMKAKIIWNQRLVRILLVLSWIIGFAISAPMIEWANGNYLMINETMVLNFYHPERMGQAYFTITVIGLPLTILQVVAYIIMFFTALRYAKVQVGQPGRPGVYATQLKLAITAFIMSVNLMLVMAFTALASAGGQYFNTYYFIYKIALDVFYESNPYLLLICSSPLRREFLKLIGFSKKKSNVADTITQQKTATNAQSLRNSYVSVRF